MRKRSCLLPAIGAVATLAIGAAMACSGSDCVPRTWDLRTLDWFAAPHSPALDAMFTTITWLGSLWLLLPLALALIATLAVRGHAAVAARFAAAFGGCHRDQLQRQVLGRARTTAGARIAGSDASRSVVSE